MPLSISSIKEDEYFYSDSFRTLMRSHKEFLVQRATEREIVDQSGLHACKNDFYKFMLQNGVAPQYWWVCAYINDITTPYQYIGKMKTWLIPDISYIETLISRSNTESS